MPIGCTGKVKDGRIWKVCRQHVVQNSIATPRVTTFSEEFFFHITCVQHREQSVDRLVAMERYETAVFVSIRETAQCLAEKPSSGEARSTVEAI